MKHPNQVVAELAATSSRNDKERILLQAWNAGCTEFFQGCQMALNPLVTFGVAQIPLSKTQVRKPSFGWKQFEVLSAQLSRRELTGNAARDAILDAMNKCDMDEWNNWYRKLLLKDLKAGLSEKTINKVLKSLGKPAQVYEVPVFTCQLAKPADDHPNKMKGWKLCDAKYDGTRLLTVIRKTGEVQQFTRNGLENKNFHHIGQMLSGLASQFQEDMVLDGEVISVNFQTLMTQVNRKKNIDTSDSRLVLFDMIPLAAFQSGEYKVGQEARHKELSKLESQLNKLTRGAVVVEPQIRINLDTAQGQAQLHSFNQQVLASGREGIMIKDPKASYKTKRSDAWLKLKPSESFDLEVVSVEAGTPDSKYEDVMGAVVFRGVDQGRKIEVSVGSGWSDDDRAQIWKARKRILGRIGEIKGDVATLSQGSDVYSLRFPVFVRWRGVKPGEKM